MSKMSKAQIEEAVRKGEHIAVGTIVLRRDPITLRPDAVSLQAALGVAADPEKPGEIEAVLVRTADGQLTRAGMEHAIKHGGSVLLSGAVISSLDDLPDEASLAEGNEERLRAHTAALDAQIAALSGQRQAAQAAAERASKQASKPSSEPASQPAAAKQAPPKSAR